MAEETNQQQNQIPGNAPAPSEPGADSKVVDETTDPARPKAFQEKLARERAPKETGENETPQVSAGPAETAPDTTPENTSDGISQTQEEDRGSARPKIFQEKLERERAAREAAQKKAQKAQEKGPSFSAKIKGSLSKTAEKIKLAYIAPVVIILFVGIAGYMFIATKKSRDDGDSTTLRPQNVQSSETVLKRTVQIGGKTIDAELANSVSKRKTGLMFRESLPENEGMLFTFAIENTYGFWMKNMNFPIDIIWINSNLTIVDITTNVQPCTQNECESYTPVAPVQYVLEMNSGWAQSNGINIGDTIEFPDNTGGE